jgi:hypothetical protein
MVISIQSQKQTTKLSMETTNIPTTQESSHIKITNEDKAHHFLWSHGYCSL